LDEGLALLVKDMSVIHLVADSDAWYAAQRHGIASKDQKKDEENDYKGGAEWRVQLELRRMAPGPSSGAHEPGCG
jgi:hypothetical protein